MNNVYSSRSMKFLHMFWASKGRKERLAPILVAQSILFTIPHTKYCARRLAPTMNVVQRQTVDEVVVGSPLPGLQKRIYLIIQPPMCPNLNRAFAKFNLKLCFCHQPRYEVCGGKSKCDSCCLGCNTNILQILLQVVSREQGALQNYDAVHKRHELRIRCPNRNQSMICTCTSQDKKVKKLKRTDKFTQQIASMGKITKQQKTLFRATSSSGTKDSF